MTSASSIRIAAISHTMSAAYRRGGDGGYRAPVKRQLPGGYELDDDPDRLDLEAVHRYLSEEAYWALGRSRETVERLAREATRVLGLYHDGAQAGFCRAFSDGVSLAYLADVYVLADHRGHGLGKAMVREMVEGSPLSGVRWILHTRDAHSLYASLGFGPPTGRVMERPPAG
jgi:GNAT superfamily N-acetyltransferase